ncbi:unnamed protein product, partial [Ectocarpus sp. 12 AP-2014]
MRRTKNLTTRATFQATLNPRSCGGGVMAAWNEVHHLNVNDLLFALGLREGRPRVGSGT